MKHLKPSSYVMRSEIWTMTSKELITEKIYVPPRIDENTGNYLDWGSYQDKAVWKETISKPFVF